MTIPSDVSLREVYALVDNAKKELLAEVKLLRSEFEGRMDLHRSEHDRDNERRNSRIRWAVTTVLAGIGVAVSLWIGLK